ncbi:hypothetical protein [Ornithinimicrobium flavum]|uniref:hypothetical protein n=1 Tax=Ornithinimicrobium flavum TaxID=1288636 RepID=UPI00130517CB|nr:hypothetical protein [Ornithinimicrobium flavum]
MTFTISDDVPLEDVLAEIRRVYDVDVQVVITADDDESEDDGAGGGRRITSERNKQDRT